MLENVTLVCSTKQHKDLTPQHLPGLMFSGAWLGRSPPFSNGKSQSIFVAVVNHSISLTPLTWMFQRDCVEVLMGGLNRAITFTKNANIQFRSDKRLDGIYWANFWHQIGIVPLTELMVLCGKIQRKKLIDVGYLTVSLVVCTLSFKAKLAAFFYKNLSVEKLKNWIWTFWAKNTAPARTKPPPPQTGLWKKFWSIPIIAINGSRCLMESFLKLPLMDGNAAPLVAIFSGADVLYRLKWRLTNNTFLSSI